MVTLMSNITGVKPALGQGVTQDEQHTATGGEGEPSNKPVFTRSDNLRSALLVQCPHCGRYFVSVHYTRTIMRNLRFGSNQAPLKTRCKNPSGCRAHIVAPKVQNTSGRNPFFRLRSYERDTVLAMVNLDAISQVNTIKYIAQKLNERNDGRGVGNIRLGKEIAQRIWNDCVGYKPSKKGELPMPFKRWENLVVSNGGARSE